MSNLTINSEILENLQTMYEDNVLQIENLQRANTRIQNLFISIVAGERIINDANYFSAPNRNTARFSATAQSNGNNSVNTHTNTSIPRNENNAETARVNNIINSLWSNNSGLNNLLRSFYEPVAVAPSNEEIETATQTLSFSSIENPVNTTCPILLETFTPQSDVMMIRHCGHLFTPTCLRNWFRSSYCCPYCRHDIRNNMHPSDDVTVQAEVTTPLSAPQEPEAYINPSEARALREGPRNFLQPINIIRRTTEPVVSNLQVHNDESITFDINDADLASALTHLASQTLRNLDNSRH